MPSPPRCSDCDVRLGTLHDLGCDVEQCPLCKGQLITCECYDSLNTLIDIGKDDSVAICAMITANGKQRIPYGKERYDSPPQ